MFTFTKLRTSAESLVKVNRTGLRPRGGVTLDIGEKLRKLRIRRGLTQEEMADRCELSKGFISQVERDLASPSIATLTDMLECLGSSLSDFFSDKPAEKTVFTPAEMFEKRDPERLQGSITWLIPDAQKNAMEPVLLAIGPDGESGVMDPGDGEEFGYVLAGSIWLCVGDKKTKVKAGSSFCLHPKEIHWLKNAGSRPAKVIWVVTPPSF